MSGLVNNLTIIFYLKKVIFDVYKFLYIILCVNVVLFEFFFFKMESIHFINTVIKKKSRIVKL